MRFSFTVYLSCLFILMSCTKERNFDERELNLISPEKIVGFDPIYVSDRYTGNETGKVYEGLFEFHPFKRPYELVPNLAEGMPSVSEDGLTYTFKIKSGVLFHDSPCFPDGVGRAVTADDVLYSLRRLADSKLLAKGWWLLDDKIVGLNEWREKTRLPEPSNYDEPIEGLKKIDDRSFQIVLKKPFPQLLYAFAMPYTFVVAKEAVAHFGKQFLNHPVGTGPFKLNVFEQSNTITYLKNPKFRDKFYPSEGEEGDEKAGLLADAGKKLPLVDKIVVQILPESQTQWLSFQKGKSDIVEMKSNYERAIDEKKELHSNLRSKGVRLNTTPALDVTFYAFNHEHPLFKNNLKLRQAISLAYDRAEANKLFYYNTAQEAHGVIPPGLGGYRKEFRNPYVKYDLDLAKKLLAEAGYPEGKGLPEITIETRSETQSRLAIEQMAKSLSKIGVKIKVGANTWPELLKKVSLKQSMMYTMAWGADYPDAENFLGLLYCPNQSPGSNGSNFCSPEFDALFKQATILQDSPERAAFYEKMNETSAVQVPWVFGFYRTEFYVTQAWVKNWKNMEFNHSQAQYLGVDLEVKKELSKKF